MRALLGCAVTLALCFGAPAEEKKDESIDAKKLVGKWSPKEQKDGVPVVIELTKDGKLTVRVDAKGKEITFEGTYKLDGNKLSLTTKVGDTENTKTKTITKLTDTELVSKDDKGKEETLVRVKDKDK
jgi:uncharacterized protein (TIGR03066 family)